MSTEAVWYHARDDQAVGPVTLESLVGHLSRIGGARSLVYGPGVDDWTEARRVPVVAEALRGRSAPPPPPTPQTSDEIDFEIFGQETQYVEITLDPGEVVVADASVILHVSPEIRLETVSGDTPGQKQGLLQKIKSTGKRLLNRDATILTTFLNTGRAREKVAFAAPCPGKILPVDLSHIGGELLCQKDSFLCAARGIEISVAVRKHLGGRRANREDFVLQRLAGDGLAMIHAGGTLLRRKLAAGEELRVDVACIAALETRVELDVQLVQGVGHALLTGDGIFLGTVRGPGTIWCQSLALSKWTTRAVGKLPWGPAPSPDETPLADPTPGSDDSVR